MLKKISLKLAFILSLSCCLPLAGCGLKSGLYLPSAKHSGTVPVESTPIDRNSGSQPAIPPLDGGGSRASAAGQQHQ